jgi:acyl-homoserine lactone synthase
MVLVVERPDRPLEHQTLRSMFEARKRVFVDLLKWDVPVLEGRYEVDQFDDEHAVYVIVTDARGDHAGSARLLQTCRPHILDSLFAELCEHAPPRGRDILEITRFCLDRRQPAARRLHTRNRLVTALVDFALQRGISSYTGVAELGWFQQILAFGWRCRPLGLPRVVGAQMLGALQIGIEPGTPGMLAGSGIYDRTPTSPARELEAA